MEKSPCWYMRIKRHREYVPSVLFLLIEKSTDEQRDVSILLSGHMSPRIARIVHFRERRG